MKYLYNDGGRREAGFQGITGDCVVRAIAIAIQKPYKEVYDKINVLGRQERIGKNSPSFSNSRTGVWRKTYQKYLENLGWKWIPTMFIGSGCKVHLRAEELPRGRLIVRLSRHITAVIDSIINDIYNPSRNNTRCVYGYFIKDE